MRSRISTMTLMALAVLLVLSPAVFAGQAKGTSTSAHFQVAHPNGCTVTTASVFVYDNRAYEPGGPPEAQPRVDFVYRVFGQPTGAGCDPLWYYDLHGSAPLGESEFSVSSNRKTATLVKTLEVYDEEAGVPLDVTIHVEWVAAGEKPGNCRPAEASLSLTGLESQYLVNPLEPSTTAEIARIQGSGSAVPVLDTQPRAKADDPVTWSNVKVLYGR